MGCISDQTTAVIFSQLYFPTCPVISSAVLFLTLSFQVIFIFTLTGTHFSLHFFSKTRYHVICISPQQNYHAVQCFLNIMLKVFVCLLDECRQFQFIHGKRDPRAARVVDEHDERSSEFRQQSRGAWRPQRLHDGDSPLPTTSLYCLRHKLPQRRCGNCATADVFEA